MAIVRITAVGIFGCDDDGRAGHERDMYHRNRDVPARLSIERVGITGLLLVEKP